MDTAHFRDLLARFSEARVLVVGDIYLDENVYGVVTGISLEAPIPIYEVHERKHNPGAAGNAACNVAALGAKTYMIGYVGNDVNADIVRKEFALRKVDTSGVVVHPTRATNTYGKLRAGGFNIPTQEILRTDTPTPVLVDGDVEEQIIANIWERAPEVDAIIVTDQVTSVATRRVLDAVVKCAEKYKLITVGDSRGRAGEFHGFDVMVPNDREAGIGTGIDVQDEATLNAAGAALLKVCKNALVTRGQHGIRVFASDGAVDDFPTTVDPGSVVDVTGAGDTVTAAVTVTLVAGGDLKDAAQIGNFAAGVAVAQRGVVTVPIAQLERALFSASGPAKLKGLGELKGELERLRAEGKRVVWTNGCFDILHLGHITYLQRAAALGDVLVVG
ncbi:MAG TPA: PfkB family carbohydrate kinase, partial [Candidatus Hydrogenedentes bacterium]|nr:PfkB family carbohydrate kinase [Candidatus Hydrogenedentota bacterium]